MRGVNTYRGHSYWRYLDPVRPDLIIGARGKIRATIAAMFRAFVPAFVALSAVLVACERSSDPSGAAEPTASASTAVACAPARTARAGDAVGSVTAAGVERSYTLHVPSTYDGASPVPLVVAFTGLGMTPEAFATFTGLPAAGSDAYGFLLAIVSPAEPGQAWGTQGADIDHVSAVIDTIEAGYCVDAQRIFFAGFSDGAGVAQVAACRLTNRVAAIGVVASVFQSCRADVPMIAFHGVDDAIVPFEGGTAPPPADQTRIFPNVRRAVSEWAKAGGCDGLATISRATPDVELSTYKRCRGGDGEVLLYAAIGAGHTWPDSAEEIAQLGVTARQIDATTLMWQFFESHPSRGSEPSVSP